MVSVLAFYSDIQSSNPDEVTERTKINKKRPGLARFKNTVRYRELFDYKNHCNVIFGHFMRLKNSDKKSFQSQASSTFGRFHCCSQTSLTRQDTAATKIFRKKMNLRGPTCSL